MKKIPILIFAIIALFGFMQYSCDFEPTGVYVAEIKHNPNVDNLISEGALSQDTIYLNTGKKDGLKVNWKFKLKQKIYRVDFFQNNSKLTLYPTKQNSIPDSGFFYVKTDSSKIYQSTLSSKIYVASDNNSILDLYGKDTVKLDRKWVLIIFPSQNLPSLKGQTLKKEGLDVVVSYSKFEDNYFYGYYLIKNNIDTVDFTKDINKTSLRDTTYFGEYSVYKILAKTVAGNYTAGVDLAASQEPTCKFYFKYVNGKIEATLIKNKYFERMKKCVVSVSTTTHTLNFDSELSAIFENVAIKNFFTATFSPKFNLKATPNLIYQTNYLANQTSFFLNVTMRDKNYAFATTDSLMLLNLQDYNDYRKIYPKYPFALSPDCKLMAIFSFSPLWIQIYNTTTLELSKRISPNLQSVYDDVQIAVSNNGIIAFESYTGNSIIRIIDSKTNSKIDDIPIQRYVNFLKISGDGQIIVADSIVYKYNGTKYVENGKIDGVVRYVDLTQPNVFYYLTKKYKLASKDLSTNNILREYPASYTLSGFDQFNNNFAYYSNGTSIKVIDLISGNLKHNIFIDDDFWGSLSFIGNTLFIRSDVINYYLTVE